MWDQRGTKLSIYTVAHTHWAMKQSIDSYWARLWDCFALLSRLDCPSTDLSVCSLLLPLQVVLSDCSSNPDLQEQENDPGEFVQSCEHGDCRHSFMSGNKEYIRDEYFCNLSNTLWRCSPPLIWAYNCEVKANILRSNYYWTLFYNFHLKTFHVR